MAASPVNTKCNFAWMGTYGHECGNDATLAAEKPSERTATGLYYGARCAACAKIKGGENAGVIRFEPIDTATQINEWR